VIWRALTGENEMVSFLYLMIAVLLLVLLFVRKRKEAKRTLKVFTLLKSPNGVAQKRFYDGWFALDHNLFPYDQISGLAEGKRCFYIVVGKAVTLIIQKDAFTIGDYETFVVFLSERLGDKPKLLKRLQKVRRKNRR